MSTNKCLVTKLKSFVENDNLPIIGEAIVTIKKNNLNHMYLALYDYYSSFRIISGNAVLRESDGSIVKKLTSNILYPYTEGNKGIDISEGNVVIAFTGKYEFTNLQLNGEKNIYESKQIPLKDLKYFSNCTTLELYGNIGFGDLVDAADAIHINEFYFNNRSSNTYITGNLDEFALAQITYGKTSGTTIISTNDKITYQGEVQESSNKFKISYDSTYPNGYTITKI